MTGWTEDRRYPAADGEHMIVVYRKQLVMPGGETQTRWKNQRRKLSRADRLYLEQRSEEVA